MGVQAILDRFSQVSPKILIAADGVHYAGKPQDRSAIVAQLDAALSAKVATILVETPYAAMRLPDALSFAQAVAEGDATACDFEPEWVDFDHPLWILYSSGTTGLPKPIVHGHGGALLTTMTNAKHIDLGPSYDGNNLGERFHWFTSTGWVMWNAQISGLLTGTTICLYDGSPSGTKDAPDWGVLWRFAARHKVTFFGSGAAFYANCMKAGLELTRCGDLSSVRALGSTGSPLTEEVQRWGTEQFSKAGTDDIWWYNVSGGTDLGGAFCTGNRELPLVPGQMQCRQLGAAVEAWNEAGEPVVDQVG
jgi:acetoacetyl-CoA synthetase